MKKKKTLLSTLVLLMIAALFLIYNNVYYRTAILRTFAKGSWYVTSERDTIYTMGYYGIRKYLSKDGKLELLSVQDDFCNNTLIARSAVINDEVIYVICRSYLPGTTVVEDNENKNGALVVLNKSDLKVKKILYSDIKYVEADIEEERLVITGLQGFDIYNVEERETPTVLKSYRYPQRKEFQGMDIYAHKDSLYLAVATYAVGFEIWNITYTDSIYQIRSVNTGAIKDMSGGNCIGNMVFDLIVDYPYLYATIAPLNIFFGTKNEVRGAVIYDIEKNIAKVIKIPHESWYSVGIGDKEPTSIDKYGDYVVTNFADKGIAIFKVDNKGGMRYLRTEDVGNEGAHVQPIHITNDGVVISGNYWWSDIYDKKMFDN